VKNKMDKLMAKLEEVLMGRLSNNPRNETIDRVIAFLKFKYSTKINTD